MVSDSPRKWSFSTNAFTEHTLVAAVEAIGQVGYDGVEILADSPHLDPFAWSMDDLNSLRQTLDSAGLAVVNLNANTAVSYYGGYRRFWEPLFEPSLANPETEARRWRIDYTKNCIDAAAYLRADCVSVTSGRPVPGILPERSLDFLEQSLREVLDHAGERGVRLGIEYEPGLLIGSAYGLRGFLDRLDAPGLGVNWDIGHSRVAGEEPDEVIDLLGKKIFHLHLEDIKGRCHYHLIPGQGDIDFPKVFDLLGRSGYEGFATVELYTYPHAPEQAAREALAFLSTITPLRAARLTSDYHPD